MVGGNHRLARCSSRRCEGQGNVRQRHLPSLRQPELVARNQERRLKPLLTISIDPVISYDWIDGSLSLTQAL